MRADQLYAGLTARHPGGSLVLINRVDRALAAGGIGSRIRVEFAGFEKPVFYPPVREVEVPLRDREQ